MLVMEIANNQIRMAEMEDLKSIQAIFDGTIRSVCNKDYNAAQIDAWAAGAKFTDRWLNKLKNQYFIVVENDGDILGFASLDRGSYLDFMYVHKDHQGKGIASLLYRAIEREAIKQGANILQSDVSKTAKPFFERMGFQTEREQTVVIAGIAINNFRMQKKLHLHPVTIRNATPNEFEALGKLLVSVYSQLEGFPNESEQPEYYQMLYNIGDWTRRPHTELLVAVSDDGKLLGGLVYFGDMQYYGSGGTATSEKNAAGFRLLAVDPVARGKGIGKLLTNECIGKALDANLSQVIIHSTKAMQTAWNMYESMGFKRSEDLDFVQGTLSVYGFRLDLSK
jgi:GNAT superfamily N-acetyltransferase